MEELHKRWQTSRHLRKQQRGQLRMRESPNIKDSLQTI
jgi:hypothetical protein